MIQEINENKVKICYGFPFLKMENFLKVYFPSTGVS